MSGCDVIPLKTRYTHCKQQSMVEPVTVTMRSDVETKDSSSFGDNRIDETPVVSSMNFILDPDLPMIMPQQDKGTSSRTTKSKEGIKSPSCCC